MHRLVLCALALSLTAVMITDQTLLACDTPQTINASKSEQPPVMTRSGINSVLASLPRVTYQELAPEFRESMNMNGRFLKRYQGQKFYVVKETELDRRLVGHFRIREFIMPVDTSLKGRFDSALNELLGGRSEPVRQHYLLMDKAVLYRLLHLMKELQKAGHNPHALAIDSGFRAPAHNEHIGGAKKSQHLWGKAIDFRVKDINGDGLVGMMDKRIVLDILERRVIAQRGGIGRYLDHDTALHIDVRGYPARWNR
ncbi:MAG: YcbK family protein [Bradymonadia bacterium]